MPLCAPAYAAGILCGTVRDAVTANPIVGAGIFLRQTTGQYTGFNGATDATGHYCISGIPAGTYDLEVRLDDYQVAYRRGVVVNDVTGERRRRRPLNDEHAVAAVAESGPLERPASACASGTPGPSTSRSST